MLFPFMMTSAYASLHKQTLHRQWKGLLCIGLFMVRCTCAAWCCSRAHQPAKHSCMASHAPEWVVHVNWQAMNIALNNLSLVRISLSLNQVIRWVTRPTGCTQMCAVGITL
jgi:hypothetical protein